jgi:hypothetical protein
MALGPTPTLQEINTELSTSGKSLRDCILLAGKTGLWDRQSDFANFASAFIEAVPDTFNNVSYNANSVSSQINSSGTWTASTAYSFITVVNSTGSDGDTLNIDIADNPSGIRDGIVQIKLDADNTVNTSIYISQLAYPTLSINPTSITIDYTSQYTQTNVMSNSAWSHDSTTVPSWLTVTSGSGSGNGVFTVFADTNDGAYSRSAYITIWINSDHTISETFTVIQTKQ